MSQILTVCQCCMWGPDSALYWTFLLIGICLNCLSERIKQNSHPAKQMLCLSSVASNVLGARRECFFPKSVLVIESHLANKPLQIRYNLKHQFNCDLLSFCFLGLLAG